MLLKHKNSLGLVALLSFVLILFVTSCTTVKNSPNQAFVYDNIIQVSGKLAKEEKKRLTTELNNYWDDSMRVVKQQKFWILFTLKNPPRYDSVNIKRSQLLMTNFLKSQGYYYADVTPLPSVFTHKKNQERVTTRMKIDVGTPATIDTIIYNITDTTLSIQQNNILRQLSQQYSKKNNTTNKKMIFSKKNISQEIENLVLWYRNNGFYSFKRDNIYALVDTTNERLLQLTTDPLEISKIMSEAATTKAPNTKWKVSFQLKNTADTTAFIQYYIRKNIYYPNVKQKDNIDSLSSKEWQYKNFIPRENAYIYQDKFTFKPPVLLAHTYLKNGQLFSEKNYVKSLNAFSQIPAWQQVDGKINIVNKDSLDIYYYLTPYKKYQSSYNFESSLSSGSFTGSNLVGFYLSTRFSNRNAYKQAISSNIGISAGLELNLLKNTNQQDTLKSFVQATQLLFSYGYTFPKLLLPFRSMQNWFGKAENKTTTLYAGASYTSRFQTFKMPSANINLSWNWQSKKSNFFWKPINIELYKIDTLSGLDSIFAKNPFLRSSFKSGNVVGFLIGNFGWSRNFVGRNPNINHFVTLAFEESGWSSYLIKNLNKQFYSYIKMEADYKYNHNFPKTSLAFHFFSGVGVPFNALSLPFFKQYYAGGPNSMRAWGLRELGLGSSLLSDTLRGNAYQDRYGDIKLEANLEYRFGIANFTFVKLGSALFMDVGNVWNFKKNDANLGSDFSLNRLGKDLAIAIGTGLRLDFSLILVRFDFGIKLKDPARQQNNGWLNLKDFSWTEHRNNGVTAKNFAFQFAIGLPF